MPSGQIPSGNVAKLKRNHYFSKKQKTLEPTIHGQDWEHCRFVIDFRGRCGGGKHIGCANHGTVPLTWRAVRHLNLLIHSNIDDPYGGTTLASGRPPEDSHTFSFHRNFLRRVLLRQRCRSRNGGKRRSRSGMCRQCQVNAGFHPFSVAKDITSPEGPPDRRQIRTRQSYRGHFQGQRGGTYPGPLGTPSGVYLRYLAESDIVGRHVASSPQDTEHPHNRSLWILYDCHRCVPVPRPRLPFHRHQ